MQDSRPDTASPDAASTFVPSRRGFLQAAGVIAAGAVLPVGGQAAFRKPQIALSDIGVGLRQQFGLFPLAAAAGVDGVEIDMGRLGTGQGLRNRLADAGICREFVEAAATAGLRIAALHVSAATSCRFATDPRTDAVLAELLDTLSRTGVRIGVLPVGFADDLTRPDARAALVDRLRPMAGRAAREGRTIVLDTLLGAGDLEALLDAIGSPAVTAAIRVNADAVNVVRRLGAERVGQIRYRSNAVAAGLGRTLGELGWQGWTVLDRTTPGEHPAEQCAVAAREASALLA